MMCTMIKAKIPQYGKYKGIRSHIGEMVLLSIGPDSGHSLQRLPELGVDWAASNGLDALELPGCWDVKPGHDKDGRGS